MNNCSSCKHVGGPIQANCQKCFDSMPGFEPKEPQCEEVELVFMADSFIREPRDITVALRTGDGDFYGVAWCDPADAWNQDKGEKLAQARALRKWADFVECEARK